MHMKCQHIYVWLGLFDMLEITNIYLNRFLYNTTATTIIITTTTAITGPTIAATGGLLSSALLNSSAAENYINQIHVTLLLASFLWVKGKQCRSRSEAT